MNEVATLITNVGFPIAMCLLILYYWNNQFTKQMDKLTEIVSQLNVAINKLLVKLESDDEPKN